MRILLGTFLLTVLSACTDTQPPDVERIDIRVSGWSSADISMNRQGEGSYHLSKPRPDGKSGTFSFAPQRFDQIRQRLEPYRRTAVPFTDQSARNFALYECPKGVPFVTDAGGVYVRWIGPKSDQHFLADLGCDADKNATRNKDLLAIVESLPIPLN